MHSSARALAGSVVAAFIDDRLASMFTRLLLVALAGMLVSCASIKATTTPYVGAPHFPPSDPAAVEIMRTEPTRPHQRLGDIMVDASTEPVPPMTEVED